MEHKELIKNVTCNEYGDIKPIDESVFSHLQILIPKTPSTGTNDDELYSYKNCNSFELLYDNRQPQILYYLGDYMYNPDLNPNKFHNVLDLEGVTISGSDDLMVSYKICEAIKKWAENTMYLIGEKCVKEVEDNLHKEVDEYCEESRKRILDKLYELGKEQYDKEKGQNINNKQQDDENN